MKLPLLALALLTAAYTHGPVNGNDPHPRAEVVANMEHLSRGAIYAPPPPVQLPILVGFGPDGGTGPSTTTVTLTAGPGGADSLYFHAMNAAYAANDTPGKATFDPANLSDLSRHERRDDAACLRINGGEWICDWNESAAVSIRRRERLRGGFGGWYSNVRAAVRLPDAVQGGDVVTVEWRWNGTEGLRSGYRLHELDLIGPNGRQHHPTTLTDPQPYSTHPDSIAQGRLLWTTRNILTDSRIGGVVGPVVASCNDCHVSGGRDLARFNYEPEVITARGVFHGLTKAQARNVANYITSLTLTPATAEGCRPWNPPFQPAPGLDQLPVGAWLCGGGAGSVLESDAQMLGGLFPGGTGPDQIRATYGGTQGDDWERGVNRRVMPIPHPLPVWNSWLPRISLPDIALDWHAYCQSNNSYCYETSDLGRRTDWGRYYDGFDTPAERAAKIETQRRYFQGTSGGVNHEWPVRNNGVQVPVRQPEYTGEGFWHMIAQQSIHQALALRLFDVVTHSMSTPWGETGWELVNDIHCGIPNTPGHPYTWPDGTMLLGPTAPGTGTGRTTCAEARGLSAAQQDWTFYAVSTHISSRDGTGGPWDYSSEHTPAVGRGSNGFGGHIWYTLAQILEPPSRWTNPGSPSDENYVHGHTFGAVPAGGTASLEAIADGLGMIQRMQGPLATPRIDDNWKGWHLHHAMHQRWLYEPTHWQRTTQQLGPQVAADIQAGLAEAWLDWSERYTPQAWDAVRGTNYGDLDERSATFSVPGSPHPGEWMTPGEYLMHWTALLQRVGARASTVDRMARFGASLFDTPSGFAAFFCEPSCTPAPPANEPPSTFIVRPKQGARFVSGYPLVVTVDATDRDGTVALVRLICDSDGDGDREVCATETEPPEPGRPWVLYTYLPRGGPASVYVEAVDDAGGVTRTGDRGFSLVLRADF